VIAPPAHFGDIVLLAATASIAKQFGVGTGTVQRIAAQA
jgi:hypothetical protein